MNAKPKRWTEDEDEALLAAINNGQSLDVFGESIGRTGRAVRSRIQYLRMMSDPKSKIAQTRTVFTKRKCLRCGSEFKSTGSMNRLCLKCRNIRTGLPSAWVYE
jgi:hypothetical protein